MALGETSEVRPFNCPNCNDLQNSLDMVADELQKVIDEYNKIAQDKKDWQILLEASQIEVDLLTEELEEVKMQLNSARKSSSHSYVRSNIFILNRRRSPNQNCNKSNRSILSSPSPDNSTKVACYTCGEFGHKSFNCRNILLENGSGDQKLLIIKDPKILGYLKETNLVVLQEPSKKTYRKGMWVLDNGCSRHMCGNKEIFKTIKIWGKERELSQAQNA